MPNISSTNWCTLLQYCKLDEWKIVVAMVDGSMGVDKPNTKYMTYNSIGNESQEGNYIGTSSQLVWHSNFLLAFVVELQNIPIRSFHHNQPLVLAHATLFFQESFLLLGGWLLKTMGRCSKGKYC